MAYLFGCIGKVDTIHGTFQLSNGFNTPAGVAYQLYYWKEPKRRIRQDRLYVCTITRRHSGDFIVEGANHIRLPKDSTLGNILFHVPQWATIKNS